MEKEKEKENDTKKRRKKELESPACRFVMFSYTQSGQTPEVSYKAVETKMKPKKKSTVKRLRSRKLRRIRKGGYVKHITF